MRRCVCGNSSVTSEIDTGRVSNSKTTKGISCSLRLIAVADSVVDKNSPKLHPGKRLNGFSMGSQAQVMDGSQKLNQLISLSKPLEHPLWVFVGRMVRLRQLRSRTLYPQLQAVIHFQQYIINIKGGAG